MLAVEGQKGFRELTCWQLGVWLLRSFVCPQRWWKVRRVEQDIVAVVVFVYTAIYVPTVPAFP